MRAIGAIGVIGILVMAVSVGCSNPGEPKSASPPPAAPQAALIAPAPSPSALPAPEALTGVVARLADPGIPGADKMPLVAETTPPDAQTFDRFAAALRDGGFVPLQVTATDVRWSDSQPGQVWATVTLSSPAPDQKRGLTFPMEFSPAAGGWQLTRETAETLLAFDDARTGS